MTSKHYTRKPISIDLPEVPGLRRTGQAGELMSDRARKEEIQATKRGIKENQPPGVLNTIVSSIGGREAEKMMDEEIERKARSLKDLQHRLKELRTTTD